MSATEVCTEKPARPRFGRLKSLRSAIWEEEIGEVLSSAGLPPQPGDADPDWQAASGFLLRHCREILAGWR